MLYVFLLLLIFILYLFSRLYTQRAFNFHYKLIVCRSTAQREGHIIDGVNIFGCNLNSLTFFLPLPESCVLCDKDEGKGTRRRERLWDDYWICTLNERALKYWGDNDDKYKVLSSLFLRWFNFFFFLCFPFMHYVIFFLLFLVVYNLVCSRSYCKYCMLCGNWNEINPDVRFMLCCVMWTRTSPFMKLLT